MAVGTGPHGLSNLNVQAGTGLNVHTTLAIRLLQHFKITTEDRDILGPPVCLVLSGGGWVPTRNVSVVTTAMRRCVARLQKRATRLAAELEPLSSLSVALEVRKLDLQDRVKQLKESEDIITPLLSTNIRASKYLNASRANDSPASVVMAHSQTVTAFYPILRFILPLQFHY
eukprot:Gregarina_sp_Poly_1__3971@NODE_2199_length_2496_cov_47_464389_g1417_i0_p2_GENE_NODE_2199_length_2496_cov_47_464389_g1417_i0NODE_2199_length_2496_cov_47_464389_g1417_i0_p2_ORF_typecomplete_len172_score21_40GP57/PF17594_2/0_17JIP_LZII/PF16471_5/0_19_NODE_2199_length_2496_cov_47_464389_g1417_i09411456